MIFVYLEKFTPPYKEMRREDFKVKGLLLNHFVAYKKTRVFYKGGVNGDFFCDNFFTVKIAQNEVV